MNVKQLSNLMHFLLSWVILLKVAQVCLVTTSFQAEAKAILELSRTTDGTDHDDEDGPMEKFQEQVVYLYAIIGAPISRFVKTKINTYIPLLEPSYIPVFFVPPPL